ncbi:PfkB family carbohydrate kinase [Antarcticimicrobium luteum]|uniref:Kinase n=1 Tax=Antarcticimicrobium luteum TaxID=2547397 RepID=A0A4V3AR30_9RHOB|nr:PfkB family carbohydrate kinase [Antarcticimicrobium luteum]TDK45007.1 kinase [Antarcticimicrobium luteum]
MNTRTPPPVLCIGSVLWDMIGRAAGPMHQGADVPGRITRLPGGVAMNIAMALTRFGLIPTLLTAIGRDAEGDELIAACARMGMTTEHIYRPDDLPTDRYLAVEGANGLIAAIADAFSLEAAGARILAPLTDGSLGHAGAPFAGTIALDGNLTATLLAEIAASPDFAAADLRVAPASPGKAERLAPFLTHPRSALYVNLEEAGLLCDTRFADSGTAAAALLDRGAARALVTDSAGPAADAHPGGVISLTPPAVPVARVTGAGDTFMAAHIAAEAAGATREEALRRALGAAAAHVSGDRS